jgi:phosphatidylserine decarboxylase
MLYVEQGIVKQDRIRRGDMAFMQANARVINEVYCPQWRYKYYMVQIADSDVSIILHFKPDEQARLNQGERFGMIRWGSMVAMILPLDPRFRFKPLCKVTDHVEAGLDALVRIDHA